MIGLPFLFLRRTEFGFAKDDFFHPRSQPLFIVGHSHGCSQVIQAINSLTTQQSKAPLIQTSRIKGIILIGGALSDGPSSLAKDGGHWIFTYLPMFLLRNMQPSLSESFFQAAVHPSSQDRIRETAMAISNRNDMRFCKAFYRQQIYATSQEAKQVQVKALVIHGVEDLVLPVAVGGGIYRSRWAMRRMKWRSFA